MVTIASRARCAFNRFVLVVLSLAGLAGALALIVSPALFLSTATTDFNSLRSAPAATITATAIVVAIVCAAVCLLEILGWGGRKVFEARVDGGAVEYPASMVAKALEIELGAIDGIQTARVEARGSSHRVDPYVTLAVSPDEDSQELAARAASAIHEKLEGLGLESGRLRLAFKPAANVGSAPNHRVAQVA